MSATELQALLRFLSRDAKLPLASAMGKVKDLQAAALDSPDKLAKARPDELQAIFGDEKSAKQILSAAKRSARKRAADGGSPAGKKRKEGGESLFSAAAAAATMSPAEFEASLALPRCAEDERLVAATVVWSNRAPLVLAFVVTLLKHTMPEQPLSSRLSIAQGYVGVTSRARAIYLGIEQGTSAEEEGFGEGQPVVRIMGKEIRVLRRWGYEWRGDDEEEEEAAVDPGNDRGAAEPDPSDEIEAQPAAAAALWALDLEALKKSNNHDPIAQQQQQQSKPPNLSTAAAAPGSSSGLPIYTPQSARAYLLKAFEDRRDGDSSSQKTAAAALSKSKSRTQASHRAKAASTERNLGLVLRSLDLLYESWAGVLGPEELDKRTWGWYVRVRPEVEQGAAGWGGKNEVKLGEILALRRTKEGDGVAPLRKDLMY